MNRGKGFLIAWHMMQAIIEVLGGQFGTPGASDFIGQLKDGRPLAIETRPGRYSTSQLTVHQRSFLATVNKYGGSGYFV